jgi:choline dehydrogenase-like flavoprotein
VSRPRSRGDHWADVQYSDRKEGIAILQRYLGGTMQTVYDWNVTTAPQQFLGTANAVQRLTLGKVLGGSSVMNGMM